MAGCLRSVLAACPQFWCLKAGANVSQSGRVRTPIGATGQTAFANQMLAAVNQYRVQQALTEWPLDETLVPIALDHSRLMAQRARLGHDGFDGRFQRARSQLCVETLATGFSRAEALVVAWRQLPTHHANLREPKVRRRSAPIRPVAPGQTRAR